MVILRPSTIDFEQTGIGTALARNRLVVPPNQREYSWEENHVLDLFQDLASAVSSPLASEDNRHVLSCCLA